MHRAEKTNSRIQRRDKPREKDSIGYHPVSAEMNIQQWCCYVILIERRRSTSAAISIFPEQLCCEHKSTHCQMIIDRISDRFRQNQILFINSSSDRSDNSSGSASWIHNVPKSRSTMAAGYPVVVTLFRFRIVVRWSIRHPIVPLENSSRLPRMKEENYLVITPSLLFPPPSPMTLKNDRICRHTDSLASFLLIQLMARNAGQRLLLSGTRVLRILWSAKMSKGHSVELNGMPLLQMRSLNCETIPWQYLQLALKDIKGSGLPCRKAASKSSQYTPQKLLSRRARDHLLWRIGVPHHDFKNGDSRGAVYFTSRWGVGPPLFSKPECTTEWRRWWEAFSQRGTEPLQSETSFQHCASAPTSRSR